MCLSYADAGFLALPFAIKESLASISTIAAAHFFFYWNWAAQMPTGCPFTTA